MLLVRRVGISVGVLALACSGCGGPGGADAGVPADGPETTALLGAPAVPVAPQAAEDHGGAPSAAPSLTAAQVGMLDPRMRALIEERDRAERELAQLRVAGVLDGNPKARQLREGLADVERRIDAYAAEWKAAQAKVHGERRSAERSRLQEAFPGAVDLYFDAAALQSRRPALSRVRLVGEVEVGGRRMLRFAGGGGEAWLIDPGRIVAATVNR